MVLAANPCPRGEFRAHAGANRCSCRDTVRRDYRRKVTGPVTDRIDITRQVDPVRPHERRDPLAVRETSADVRVRVTAARRRQAERYRGCTWRLNSQVPGAALRERWPLAEDGQGILDTALYDAAVTSRGAVRVHRLAWTVLDLLPAADPERRPGGAEVETALRLRSGHPLLLSALQRGA